MFLYHSTNKTEEKGLTVMNKFNKKPTILVVDDTPDMLNLVMELLKNDYNLKLANGSKKAIDFLQNNPELDLILLDVMMPDIDGFEMCSIIKSNPTYSQTPVIFLTALEKESDIIKGFKNGAIDYVTKPFMPEVLKARVKTHVELKKFQDNIIKDLEEKENLLFKQSKMAILGEMFENVTHQWKQPLSIISMSCANLKLNFEIGELKDDELVETIDIIDAETDYLSQTIDDFRDFARNNTQKELFDIRNIFDQAVTLLSFRFNKASIDIYNDMKSFKYRSYKNDLIQVLMNILNNAIDVLEKQNIQGHIKTELIIKESEVILKICDNGGGIKVDNIDSIFHKYVTTKNKKEDAGLGLYMCRQIMDKRINGKISAYNESDGVCFELLLPIVNED